MEQGSMIFADDAVELTVVKVTHAIVQIHAPVRAGIGEGVQAVVPAQHEAFLGQFSALKRERLALAVRKPRGASDTDGRQRAPRFVRLRHPSVRA
jgi:hypothetical protein